MSDAKRSGGEAEELPERVREGVVGMLAALHERGCNREETRQAVAFFCQTFGASTTPAWTSEVPRLERELAEARHDNERLRKALTEDDHVRKVAAGVARDCAVVFGSMDVGVTNIETIIAERIDYWLTPGPTTPLCEPLSPPSLPAGDRDRGQS